MKEYKSYFEYLKRRSPLGLIYRKYWLYPKLDRYLSGNVLDIGCGLGDFLRFRPTTIGVDISPETVNWCVSQGLDARIMQPNLLDFPDNFFNGVVLDNVLEHLEHPESLLAEIKRILVPDGIFLVGVPGIKGYKSDADHKKYYNQNSLISGLKMSGFSCVKLFHMPIRFPFLDKLISQYCIYGVFVKKVDF